MEPLEAVTSIRFSDILRKAARPSIFAGEKKKKLRVEAGSNTSTVALRVVGGDENGSL
jgi:hypothetical protein